MDKPSEKSGKRFFNIFDVLVLLTVISVIMVMIFRPNVTKILTTKTSGSIEYTFRSTAVNRSCFDYIKNDDEFFDSESSVAMGKISKLEASDAYINGTLVDGNAMKYRLNDKINIMGTATVDNGYKTENGIFFADGTLISSGVSYIVETELLVIEITVESVKFK